jgi:hypothetical protein
MISESIAFQAPMCMLFSISLGPPVGISLSIRAPLEPIKGRVRMLEHKFHEHTRTHKLSQALTSNTTHSGCMILRSSSLNHF